MMILVQGLAWLLTGFLVLATLLPLFPVGTWWIRLGDFPRLQLAFVAIIPLLWAIGISLARSWNVPQGLMVVCCASVIAWQTSHLLQYTWLFPYEIQSADAEVDTACLRLAVVNIKFDNPQKEQVIRHLRELQADLLLLIEVNAEWETALAELAGEYRETVGAVREEGHGLMLYSQLELIDPEVRHLVTEDRPSILTSARMEDGRLLRLVGIHPTPPGLYDDENGERHDSNIRDAELMLVAQQIADDPDHQWVVTGDFNDVAWSHTTRMFQRLSGMKDPRVGRMLLTTFHADYPPLRYPIDHVFLTENARLKHLRREYFAGSDHFGIVIDFCLPGAPETSPEPATGDAEQAEEMIEKGREDAEQ